MYLVFTITAFTEYFLWQHVKDFYVKYFFLSFTREEFVSQRTGGRLQSRSFSNTNSLKLVPGREIKLEDLPDEVDWRQQGVITSVRNQGGCGSCWAYWSEMTGRPTWSIDQSTGNTSATLCSGRLGKHFSTQGMLNHCWEDLKLFRSQSEHITYRIHCKEGT